MGAKAQRKSKGAAAKKVEKSEEVVEAPEEEYVYPTWATALLWIGRSLAIMWILREAYQIRLYAINNYGRVIHEFDPWFNFRATQYLADNGIAKFFHWFDYMSWYPLGRPVGTTIYPGMQLTSVAIWKTMNNFGFPMSLNDVCCFVPAWFGVVATTFLGLLTTECTGSINSGVLAAAIMSIIPAHIMRSVGGGYDNESIAISAMCITFYFWCRSLRHADVNKGSWMIGAVAGVAHIYMAAVWGGYVFVINLVGLHAGMLMLQYVFRKDFNETLHRSYSLFYIIGTLGATRVPVVGWTPIKSLEQMMPMCVFVALQVFAYVEIQRKKDNLNFSQVFALRVKFFLAAGAVAALIIAILFPTGYFGPLSSRVRGLFVKHTRTGNPLVDSVAEHQPADARAYWSFLHYAYYMAPIGLIFSLAGERRDSMWFLVAYSLSAYFFSAKMMRLVLLAGPVASALSGVVLAKFGKFCLDTVWPSQRKAKVAKGNSAIGEMVAAAQNTLGAIWDNPTGRALRIVLALLIVWHSYAYGVDFYTRSHQMADQMSNPQIMFKAPLRDGSTVMVDDYREAYWWLRDKTPADSRVMAWWDYGYQITGIANRTTIADGNTWNHEHIATLGRALTAPLKDAHRIVRHLADYVLIWTGGGGDDLAKSPHMARIGNSVFNDICPGDPTCSMFGFDQSGNPTPMMAASLLYVLHSHRQRPGVEADSNRFEEAFISKYGKVRIFKVKSVDEKSKKWSADPDNRVCDAPGSWYCVGQYPPALRPLIEKRQAFSQLEDFNAGGDDASKKKAAEYQKQYMSRMAGKGGK
jgi:dolichyl-diphosphooligosaccharide--protein glycosyltransferase